MITYKLNEYGTWARKIENGQETGKWCNVKNNTEYLEWLAEGNEPLPADSPTDSE